MTRRIDGYLLLLLTAAVLLLMVACDSGDSNSPTDGDTDLAENDSDTDADGDNLTDGDGVDGDATDGDAVDGDSTDGDLIDGDAPDGDAVDGDNTESDLDSDGDLETDAEPESDVPTEFSIWSSAVNEDGVLATDYGCSPVQPMPDQLPSPPLNWAAAPEGTTSYVLLMSDLDPEAGGWINWVVINLADTVQSLAYDASGTSMPFGAIELENSYEDAGYGGPCPSSGTHEYAIALYALSQLTVNLSTADKSATEVKAELEALSPLGVAELRMTYTKQFPK